MTLHATNGLTTLTQSKTNVGARWSKTLAFELVRIRDVEFLVLEVHGVGTFYAQTTSMGPQNN